ncbi:MAG: acetylornithine carbamoyltransferase [Bacteroidia bacterium]
MKYFTSAYDVSSVEQLINEGLFLKNNPYAFSELGANKTLGLVFMNPSLRTRLSTLKAAQLLGMNTLNVNAQTESWALELNDVPMNGTTVEHIKEAAAVMGEYADIIGVRSFPSMKDRALDDSEKVFLDWIKYSGKPAISLESATRHPLQSLADMMTIKELFPDRKPKVVLLWAPHVKPVPQAVANSFCEWMKHISADFTVACPDEARLSDEFISGIEITNNKKDALKDADIIYVKSWCSYKNYGQLVQPDENWTLTLDDLKITNNTKVMHCLPVRRDIELASEILDSNHSVVIRQASNRVPAAQAVLKRMLDGIVNETTDHLKLQQYEI